MTKLIAFLRRHAHHITFERCCAALKILIAFFALIADPGAMTNPMASALPIEVDTDHYRVLSQPWIDERGNRFEVGSAIHQTAVIGMRNRLAPYAVIGPNTTIGDDNRIAPFAVLGARAQTRGLSGDAGLVIGDRNSVHSHATLSVGTERATTLGNDVIVMTGSHVGHDSWIRDRTTLSNYAQIAGHVTVDEGAIVGAFGCVVQHLFVGSLAHILPNQICRHSLVPGETLAANGVARVNSIGIRRMGGTSADVRAVRAKIRDPNSPVEMTGVSPWLAEALTRWDDRLQDYHSGGRSSEAVA